MWGRVGGGLSAICLNTRQGDEHRGQVDGDLHMELMELEEDEKEGDGMEEEVVTVEIEEEMKEEVDTVGREEEMKEEVDTVGREEVNRPSDDQSSSEELEALLRVAAQDWSPITRYKFGFNSRRPRGSIASKEIKSLPPTAHEAVLDKVKFEHDLAKAVKADDAEVPVHLWDEKVCRGLPSAKESAALTNHRTFCLRIYQRRLWKETRSYMTKKFGSDWFARARSGTKGAAREIRAVEEILWRAAENEWFKYLVGSTLMHFCFPARYRRQALEGVKVYFTREGPTSKRTQPRVGPEEKIVLWKKIQRFIERRYVGPASTKFKSSIKYFTVPKGNDDWRIVF